MIGIVSSLLEAVAQYFRATAEKNKHFKIIELRKLREEQIRLRKDIIQYANAGNVPAVEQLQAYLRESQRDSETIRNAGVD